MRTLWNPSTGARRHEIGLNDSHWGEPVSAFHLAPGDEAACEIAERRATSWTKFTSVGQMRDWIVSGVVVHPVSNPPTRSEILDAIVEGRFKPIDFEGEIAVGNMIVRVFEIDGVRYEQQVVLA